VADPAQAREQAREILSERRFQDSDVPRPFARPLNWLGERIEDVGTWFADRFRDIDASLPGGSWVVWLVIGALVAVLAVVVSRSMIRRRAVAGYGPGGLRESPPPLDPAALERDAEAAERNGDFEAAVRLRFRAGVGRLERGRRLEPGGLRTTGAISWVLDSDAFDTLGADFDDIVYGSRTADADDVRAARSGWTAVLDR